MADALGTGVDFSGTQAKVMTTVKETSKAYPYFIGPKVTGCYGMRIRDTDITRTMRVGLGR